MLSYSADAARAVARLLAAASALGVLLVWARPAAADQPSSPVDAVVGRGQEPLLAEMLGRGEALPGACGSPAAWPMARRFEPHIDAATPTWSLSWAAEAERYRRRTRRALAIEVVSGTSAARTAGRLHASASRREAELAWTSPPRNTERPMRWMPSASLFVVLIAAVGRGAVASRPPCGGVKRHCPPRWQCWR